MDKRLANKWWRLTHLYKIKDKEGKLVTFKPNEIQLRHLQERGSQRYNLILKYRQGGITTLYALDLLDEALWIPGMSCAIIAHEAKKLPEYFDIVKRAYENMPDMLHPKTRTDTKHRYDFTHRFDGAILDSSIYVATKLRGGTVLNLHVTESAFIKDRLELASGSKQAVPLNGRISEETTGNGFNEFYDDYMRYHVKVPQEQDYKTYFYPWQIDPQYTLQGEVESLTQEELALKDKYKLNDGQILWRRWKKQELRSQNQGFGLSGDQLFKQEYPMSLLEAFQSGLGNVFDIDKVENIERKQELTDTLIPEVIHTQYVSLKQKGLHAWVLPEENHNYVIGVDPSDGDGADSSCIDVWDRETMEQVAQFYGKMRPDELAMLTVEIATLYNKAFVGVENNMLTTILFLSKIYDNYYFETRIDEKTLQRTKKIGWSTNVKTRDVMIDDFIIHFDEGHLKINSPITQAEMRTFVKNENGKREHATGKHDDALFAGFVGIQMLKHNRPRARVFSEKPF